MKIMIIEDDEKTARAVHSGLRAEGYDASFTCDGDTGFSCLQAGSFDLLVLDWMLPGRDGIEILKSLPELDRKPSVLLLTARDEVEDRVRGLDAGADDYLVKPFAFAELLARVRALHRRAARDESVRHQVGDLTLDLRTRQAWRNGEEVDLTPREFDLLSCLVRNEGQVVTRQMLAREVWREPNRSTPLDNVIDVHLARLRRKVDSEHSSKLIRTVRGVGFILKVES